MSSRAECCASIKLDAESLWFDELAAVELASHPPSRLWSDWMVRETNPPLYYTLLHYWMRAFGDSAAAVRFPSALLGSAVPWILYLLGRRMGAHLQYFCREPDCQLQLIELILPREDVDRWAKGFFRGPRVHPDELASVLSSHDRVFTLGRRGDDPASYVRPLADEVTTEGLGLPPNGTLRVRSWRIRSDAMVAQPSAP